MARLKISEGTLKKLFALSGNCCAFPKCEQKLIDNSGNLIAQVCHIQAANIEGQRYNPAQTDEDRRDFSNLVIMCPNHHKITDDVEKYPTQLLQNIKAEHEAKFKNKKDWFKVEEEVLEKAYNQVNNFNLENNSGQQNLNQGGTQIIRNGLTVTEAKQVMEDRVFVLAEELKKNLIHLSKESQKIADERIETFLTEYITPKFLELTLRLNKIENGYLIAKLQSPDIQYSFNNVLQAVGRRQDVGFNNSLANLMIARIESEDNSPQALIYNEAITVFPKLTSLQLGVLSFAFLVHMVKYDEKINSPDDVNNWLEMQFGWIKSDQFGMHNLREIDFSHLEYSGLSGSGGAVLGYDFSSVVSNYKFFGQYLGEEFGFGPSLEIKTETQKEIKQKIIKIYNVYKFGSKGLFSGVRLTSVGTVLAIHWLKVIANLDFETELWLAD